MKTKTKFFAYPPTEFIPNFPTFLRITNSININKSFGGENIPLELISSDKGKQLAFDQLRLTLSQSDPPESFFQARLVCMNKLKGDDIPTTDDIRPIAITGLMQKLTEKSILYKIGEKIIKKINPAQCGFVKKKETLIHVASVLYRLK